MKRNKIWVIASIAVGILAVVSLCIPSVRTAIFHRHVYTQTVSEPTCTKDGYTTYACPCGKTYTDNIVPATGHDYVSTVVAHTYITQGFTQHVCSICQDEYKDAYTSMPSEVMSSLAQKDYLLPFEEFSRERTQNPEFVMIHFSSAVVLDPKDPYNMDRNRQIFVDYGVSTHYIMDREGNIRCYIPEDLVAYHAGYGTWGDDPKYTDLLNDYAIGIEILAIGSQKDMAQYLTPGEYYSLDKSFIGYTDAQYEALKALVTDICQRNNIPMDREHIIGHQEYSPNKKDPGELFDWDRLLS